MCKAILNVNLFHYDSYETDQFVIFNEAILETGRMIDFQKTKSQYDIIETIDGNGALVMPGLVAGHVHIYSAFARGCALDFNPKSFQDILDQQWWKIDRELDNEATYYSGILSGLEYVKNGVTTVVDHHASGKDIRGSLQELKKSICDKIGLRGIFCFETSDRFPIDQCISENVNFAKNNLEKHAGMFGIHASLSVSDNTLEAIKNSDNILPIHIHVAESKEDEDDCVKKYGMRVVERLNKYNLLKKDSLLAHCVHIDEKEAQIIKENDCWVVMNPMSNMNNAVGLKDYNFFKEQGIKVLLGNDGLGFNFAKDLLNFLFAMKHQGGSPVSVGFNDVLDVIKNGYEFAGNRLGVKLGKIKKGYVADFLVVDYNPPTPMNEKNALGHVLFGIFDNFRPKDVIVNGDYLQREYIQNIDIDEEARKIRIVAQKVWDRINRRN